MNLNRSAILNNNFSFYLFIILSTILFHYLPFERNSIGPDDFAFLTKKNIFLYNFTELASDRPLHYLFVELQNFIIGDNAFYGFIFNILSNLLLLIVIYNFLTIFFKSRATIILILTLYNLFLTKVEIYHYPIYGYLILANTLYLLSLIFFIKSFEKKFYFHIIISISIYFIAIFFYEAGFFLPIVLVLYTLIFKIDFFKKYLNIYFIFFIIALFYFIYRETNAFGLSQVNPSRLANFNSFISSLENLFNIFGGRSFIRICIYGYYQFLSIPIKWLIGIIFLDIIFLFITFYYFKRFKFQKINIKILLFFFTIFIVFLIPNMLVGGIGGRHTIIPIIFLVSLLYIFLSKIRFYNSFFIMVVISLQLIPNQGNNWSQIVSSRINGDIYESFKTNLKKELTNSEYIIFDRDSFKNNIKYQIVKNPFNLLHNYYGAQTLENWGIRSMILLNSELNKNNIYISINKPKKIDQHKYIFKEQKSINLNENIVNERIINSNKVLIINYDKIYPNGFYIE